MPFWRRFAPKDVATSLVPLLQVVAAVMTEPAAAAFRTLITGWLLAPRRTMPGMLRAGRTDRAACGLPSVVRGHARRPPAADPTKTRGQPIAPPTIPPGIKNVIDQLIRLVSSHSNRETANVERVSVHWVGSGTIFGGKRSPAQRT